ncbi:MAG TPA: hypothetical protein VM142_10850 [Acidimicrobiales bacterium]|nr:hypothetical protein [Acidimicrobiales bacterium]
MHGGVLLVGMAMAAGACTSSGAPDAAPVVSDGPLQSSCAAAREARDEIVELQGGKEQTPESHGRLRERLERVNEEAKLSINEELDPLARDALASQQDAANEELPVGARHDAFHVVVNRVGRIFTVCKEAGTPMPGVIPTIPNRPR